MLESVSVAVLVCEHLFGYPPGAGMRRPGAVGAPGAVRGRHGGQAPAAGGCVRGLVRPLVGRGPVTPEPIRRTAVRNPEQGCSAVGVMDAHVPSNGNLEDLGCAPARPRRCSAPGRGALNSGDVPAQLHLWSCPPAGPASQTGPYPGLGSRSRTERGITDGGCELHRL